jgi:carbamate kinase
MRVVVALGGNALLRRDEAPTASNQRRNIRDAAPALATLARRTTLVVSHGNGPQVGLLALQTEAYAPVEPYPLDVLGAESEGMIGYVIEQELGSLLPGLTIVTVLTMVEVDAHDPAFQHPTKPIGPVYDDDAARRIRAEGRWALTREGDGWRRVVASPEPKRILELPAIASLLESGVTVICAGGGGIPTVQRKDGRLEGVEAVIDKDRASALLASGLNADVLILATDVDAVYSDWNTPAARPLGRTTPSALHSLTFDPGSMGPKVEAASRFVATGRGRRAVIGALADIEAMLDQQAGTQITQGD